MHLTISEPTKLYTFTYVLQNIRSFTEFIELHFKEDGLYMQTLDSSRITIMELKLSNTWFDAYEFSENITLGINSNIIAKILSTYQKGHSMTITFDKNNEDTLDIEFKSECKDILNKEFTMPLVSLDEEQMSIPENESTAQFSISSNNFGNIISQLSNFGESIQINCNEENIDFIANGDSGSMKVKIDIDDLNEFAIVEDSSLELRYSLIYLSKIATFSKICKAVEIHLTHNYPLQVNYYLDEENDEKNVLKLFLAPQYNDEDD